MFGQPQLMDPISTSSWQLKQELLPVTVRAAAVAAIAAGCMSAALAPSFCAGMKAAAAYISSCFPVGVA